MAVVAAAEGAVEEAVVRVGAAAAVVRVQAPVRVGAVAVVPELRRAVAVADNLAAGADPVAEIFAAAECLAAEAGSATGDASMAEVRASAVVPLGTVGDLAEGI